MLSSDILEMQFGPTEVEVLHQSDQDRIIRTRLLSNDQTLELSWVGFSPEGVEAFPDVHAIIRGGMSMGKAFRNAEVDFIRENQSVVRSEVPTTFSERFGYNTPATVIDVSILVGPKKLLYANILEVYSPAIEWPELPDEAQESHQKRLRQFAERLVDISS